MKAVSKPRFLNLSHGENGGAPILLTLWNYFDFSFLLTQSGIHKDRGVPTWMLAFLYVIGLVAGCPSVLAMASMASDDALLKRMFRNLKIGQHTLSRFLTGSYNWSLFGQKRVERLQQDQDTRLQDGDVVALDDSQVAHPYAKMLPFLCWLYDSSQKIYTWGMNFVALHAVLRNGMEYPLSYLVWQKPEQKGDGPTKIDLAREMLLQLRNSVSCRLWVAMDRWYFCKDFFNFLTANQFDWVTKAKRNTALYRREVCPLTKKERFVPVRPLTLIQQAFGRLCIPSSSGLVSIAIPDIYMKMPYETTNRKGKRVKKQRYTPIAAVVAMRLKEDESHELTESTVQEEEQPATFKGAYLLISNRVDAPQEALLAYTKRWRIEVFFRTAKQELGLSQCHSTTEAHHHAHFELLFAAESLLNYALWQENKEKTSDDEGYTHGEMVRGLFHTRCQIHLRNHKGVQKIYVHLDTKVERFARLIHLFWPVVIEMFWGAGYHYHYLSSSA